MTHGTAAEPAAGEAVLSLRGITKRFGSLVANEAVDLDVRRGEVVALLGENGAGKTTLMNILFGHYVADEGDVLVAGEGGDLQELDAGSPRAALAAGIGMVHQHFTLAENLSGFENIILGTQGLLDLSVSRRGARRKLEALMREAGLDVALDRQVSRLSVGEKQRIEILKALYRDARILVMDEPTAVLTPQEVERLFETLRRLTSGGLSVIFIAHKLSEVLAIADRIVVLRGGRKVGETARSVADRRLIAEMMVGRHVPTTRREPGRRGGVLLELRDVSSGEPSDRGALTEVSLAVAAGEIIGIAGVSGNGQSRLSALVAGLARPRGGVLRLFGSEVSHHDPRRFAAAGVARIPEDRHHDGIIGGMTVAENVVVEEIRAKDYSRWGFLRKKAIRSRAEAAIRGYDVRCQGPDAPARQLSGGNMQKLILARVLDRAPRLVLANQPTRGLDVGAQSEVHRRLLEARARGAGVLLISEDLDELLSLSDRVAVMHGGRLSEAIETERVGRTTLGLMMAGHGREEAA
ncbi:ABC transporter ATP-binding protein [Lutibaculum baratangense]|uniref:Putative ABC sugar transporter, fused ATPaseprotein n=1 Tax=Lutibaculum baratangense AMV1 TaxID=631454 RepID=V4RVY1_9HYPH|nr:ABC transporter ATP-binding protein [Lutibaculum baratangense]ESR27195.1 putative ABC sugar transporter, fused ATPaseprotein [Lutibaculum baratangense AMV1]